jgi:hypothetical protein
MKVFLAGENGDGWHGRDFYDFFYLGSFYYMKGDCSFIYRLKDFLLDSGAFSFMNAKTKSKESWDEYIERYAKFINEYQIKHFFELDIDSIVGLPEVERLRAKLEHLTGKQCIPVWHIARGIDYWHKMVADYKYVAIGGIVTNEIKRNQYDAFLPLLRIAREHDCKVHGLGFTNMLGLQKYPFYSVDSTAWIYGNRGGYIYVFNGRTLDKVHRKEGMRLQSKNATIHNFIEWYKFQEYADKNL